MKENTATMMFALLQSAVHGTLLSQEEALQYHPELLSEIVDLAKKHDVANLVVLGLKKNRLIDGDDPLIENVMFRSVVRYEMQDHMLHELCEALTKAKIPFIPLKGSVIRRYYPEPWMRTSCDIDVLIHEEDLKRAVSYLVENLGYQFQSQFSHDVSMYTKNGKHIELHYNLLEDSRVKSAAKVLENVWDTAKKSDENEYQYEMPDDMFYFYHIAHMAKHIENGGCGIRPFLDIWVLNHKAAFDPSARAKRLVEGELTVFAKQAELLSEVWFEQAEPTEVSQQMEAYILQGGVYGTNKNRIAFQQQMQGGRMKYALSKIILPYDEIKHHYPILKKYRFLTPMMEVRRWGKLIFCGHLKRTAQELQYNNTLSKTAAAQAQTLLKNIGL